MCEQEIVVSQYHWTGIVKLVVYYSVGITCALIFAVATIVGNNVSTQILSLALTTLLYYILYAQVFQGGVIKKFIIGPEQMEIVYWIKGNEIIDYTSIKAIKTTRRRQRDGSLNGRAKQEISLFNDDVIDFTETEFVNYQEMKNAIWIYRLKAFNRLRQADATA